MKKKTLLAAVALTLAAGFAFGMAGCSGGGTSNAKKIKSEEVTEDQWNAFFGLDQDSSEDDGKLEDCRIVLNTYSRMQSYSDGILTDGKNYSETEIVIDGDKDYVRTSSRSEGKLGDISVNDEEPETVIYSEKTEKDGVPVYYSYTQNAASEWEKDGATSSAALEKYSKLMYELAKSFPSFNSGNVFNYDDFVFSADRGGYVFKTDLKGDLPVLKFKDGKLVGVWLEVEAYSNGKTETTYDVVITYEDQTVNLPTEFTDNTVEEAE